MGSACACGLPARLMREQQAVCHLQSHPCVDWPFRQPLINSLLSNLPQQPGDWGYHTSIQRCDGGRHFYPFLYPWHVGTVAAVGGLRFLSLSAQLRGVRLIHRLSFLHGRLYAGAFAPRYLTPVAAPSGRLVAVRVDHIIWTDRAVPPLGCGQLPGYGYIVGGAILT